MIHLIRGSGWQAYVHFDLGRIGADITQHGIRRVSGPKATVGPDYEKELRKIEDYRALVDTVNTKVNPSV